MAFELTSKDIEHNRRLPDAQVLNAMGYNGANQSPHLAWKGAPEGTRSFVVTCYDPDSDRLGVVALGDREHPRERQRTAERRGKHGWNASRRGFANPH
jgi:Phosphatidylethanolamine-binding protein